MSDLTAQGTSTWKSGTPDTGTQLTDGPPPTGTPGQSSQINGLLQFALDLQAVLGNAPNLKGAVADLATRLSLILAANGAVANGLIFPNNPVNAQIFYRTDLQAFYFYNATVGQWKIGFDNSAYVLVDGSRAFNGSPQVNSVIPSLRLTGTELGAADYRIKEDSGTLKTQINTGTPAIPIWADDNFFLSTGMGADFFGTILPGGTLARDGSAVSRITYARLFGVIGTLYGSGDGSTTFNLPDDRGRMTLGDGQGGTLTLRVLAGIGGEETHVLSLGELPPHAHQEMADDGVNPASPMQAAGSPGNVPVNTILFGSANNPAGSTPLLTEAAGGGSAHNTMPPFLVCKKIIKT